MSGLYKSKKIIDIRNIYFVKKFEAFEIVEILKEIRAKSVAQIVEGVKRAKLPSEERVQTAPEIFFFNTFQFYAFKLFGKICKKFLGLLTFAREGQIGGRENARVKRERKRAAKESCVVVFIEEVGGGTEDSV